MPTFFSGLLNGRSIAELPVRQEHLVLPTDIAAVEMEGQMERPELAEGSEL